METPSSMRRVTRSQTTTLGSQKKDQEEALSRTRNHGKPERSALIDITNDSPIVGLAMGGLMEKTPSSLVAKNRGIAKQTPGSGEALLRGQVKTLLQKVEEEAELDNKLSSEHRPPFRTLLGLLNSPAQLLAPTPANTPQISNLSGIKEEDVLMGGMMPFIINESDDSMVLPQVAEMNQEEIIGHQECLINRALLFDSPEKSEISDSSTHSSALTYEGSGSIYQEKSPEDDNSSAWSIQANASIQEDDEEVEDFEEEQEQEEEDEEEGEEEDEETLDDLCEGLTKMTVQEKRRLPEFTGSHVRFIYNSDDEIEGEEQVQRAVSPGVLLLKGLPVPEGKHLRFQEEEEEE